MGEFIITNKCCQCGDCCKPPIIPLKMCKTNNVIDGDLYCDFIEKRADGKFYCKWIVLAKETDATLEISKAVDSAIITSDIKDTLDMSDEQALFCTRNMHFPDSTSGRRTIAQGLVPNCSVTFEEVKDGD